MSIRLLLIAVAWFGCNKGEEQVTRPDLQIVSAGNEPRRVLRYQAPKGTKQQLEIAVDVELTAGDMGGPMPTIAMTLALEHMGARAYTAKARGGGRPGRVRRGRGASRQCAGGAADAR